MHQFGHPRAVLNFSDPEFSKTHLDIDDWPIIDQLIAILNTAQFILGHPVWVIPQKWL